MKTCPFCIEQIQDLAIKCRFCGADIRPQEQRWREGNARITGVFLHVLPWVGILLLVWACNVPAYDFWGNMLMVLSVLALVGSILVAVDGHLLGIGRRANPAKSRPAPPPLWWGLGVLLVWPVFFPLYVLCRKQHGVRSFPSVSAIGALLFVILNLAMCHMENGSERRLNEARRHAVDESFSRRLNEFSH